MLKRRTLNNKSVREHAPEMDCDCQVFDTEVRDFSICLLRACGGTFALD